MRISNIVHKPLMSLLSQLQIGLSLGKLSFDNDISDKNGHLNFVVLSEWLVFQQCNFRF